jgi:hypothetical protein
MIYDKLYFEIPPFIFPQGGKVVSFPLGGRPGRGFPEITIFISFFASQLNTRMTN